VKKLGLIGGMGPESTIPYYYGIVYGVQRKVGKKLFPYMTIESVNVFDVLNMCERQEYDALIDYLMKAINNLRASGVDFIALSANTPHIVFDELKKRSPIQLVSIVEATCSEAKQRNILKVGLLGTIITMNGEFFKNPFLENHIEVVTPTDEEKEFVNEKISQELELGIVKGETISAFLKIVQRMKDEDGIQAIILGCTELPLLFKGVKIPVEPLDTMQIHIETLVNMIVEE
jgi:aspartate racemase